MAWRSWARLGAGRRRATDTGADRLAAQLGVHVVDDLAQGVEGGHLVGVELGQAGHPLAHGGQDLDALDGVDAQVGVQRHAQLEHLGRVAGLLGDDLQHDGVEVGGEAAWGAGRLATPAAATDGWPPSWASM